MTDSRQLTVTKEESLKKRLHMGYLFCLNCAICNLMGCYIVIIDNIKKGIIYI